MVGIEDLKKLYEKEDRFRHYVDHSAANYWLTVDEVFRQALTREVAQSYMDEMPGSALTSAYMPMWVSVYEADDIILWRGSAAVFQAAHRMTKFFVTSPSPEFQ